MDSTSLKVYVNTLARKILFDDNKATTSIKIETEGGSFTLTTKKEVVISSGVVSHRYLPILNA
jgi:choline dehydrogenase